jgi:hypothetical protein
MESRHDPGGELEKFGLTAPNIPLLGGFPPIPLILVGNGTSFAHLKD